MQVDRDLPAVCNKPLPSAFRVSVLKLNALGSGLLHTAGRSRSTCIQSVPRLDWEADIDRKPGTTSDRCDVRYRSGSHRGCSAGTAFRLPGPNATRKSRCKPLITSLRV